MKIAILTVTAKRMHTSREELISHITGNNHELVIIGPEQEPECKENFAALGVRYIGVALSRAGMNPLSELKLVIALYKQFKKEQPDLMISYGIKMGVYGSLAAIFAGVVKIFPVINGRGNLFQMEGIKGTVARSIISPIMKYVFNRCSVIFFQNTDDYELFKDKKLVSEKKCTVVNGSGVNLTRFSETEMPLKPVFLLVSRLVWAKGIKEYIEAAVIVKSKFPESRFLLLGPFDETINSIKEEDLKHYFDRGIIEYKGVTSDVDQYYKTCTCYVLPSFYGEGVPRTILEAMATGRPIITTNTPGCKETVDGQKNGFLIPPKESAILAEKMCWMIENPEQARMMGRESRKYCEKKFDVNSINKIMVDLMEI